MKAREAATREAAIDVARAIVADAYDRRRPEEREWFVASPKDSYDDPLYRADIQVREGSPPKGYLLVGYGFVLGVGNSGDLLCRVRFPVGR